MTDEDWEMLQNIECGNKDTYPPDYWESDPEEQAEFDEECEGMMALLMLFAPGGELAAFMDLDLGDMDDEDWDYEDWSWLYELEDDEDDMVQRPVRRLKSERRQQRALKDYEPTVQSITIERMLARSEPRSFDKQRGTVRLNSIH